MSLVYMLGKEVISRRRLLAVLLACALSATSGTAFADGGSGSGGSGSGGSGGGSGGSGSSGGSGGSGGSDNSGKSDDNDKDEKDDDDGKKDDPDHRDSDDAYLAVKNGKAVSLRTLKNHLNANFPGKILKLEIKAQGDGFVYRVKLLQDNRKVSTISLDAKTLVRRKN
jgi:hypothetical protein